MPLLKELADVPSTLGFVMLHSHPDEGMFLLNSAIRWSEHASPASTSVLAAYPALSQLRFSTSFCVCAGWVNSPGDRAGLIVADYQLRRVPLGEHRSGGCFRSAQGPLGGTPKPEYPAERYSLLSVLGAVGEAPYLLY